VAHDEWVGKVTLFSSEVTDEDFEQPRELWRIFKRNGEDKKFASNLAAHLGKALPQVQKATVEMFSRVDKEVGEAIQHALDELESKGGAGIEHKTAPLSKQASRG
jgi:catalase